MVISAREETQNSCDRVCYCFNRDCRQPENFLEAQVCASCGSNLLLKNRYRALQLIGYGGFGRTFKGVDESQSSQPYCAIKQFWVHPNSPTVDKAIALFNQEAQRLEALGTNPSIPTLHDHFAEEGGQYLVQAFVSGRNLSQELAVEGLWNETSIRQLLLDLLPLLQFVHSCHVIHRDIKPENIIRCDRDGSLVLVDFGAAKVVTETTLEKTGTVIGSAAYTAPEQIRGKAIFASDIYSLGVTCIHLLTQVPPFDLFDSSENTWQWRHCLTQPVSESLGTILDKMLAGATNKRYQSATAVLKDLQSKPTRSTGRILLATGAALVFSLMGLEAVLSVARQVSPVPSQQETVSQSASNYESGGLYSYSDGGAVQTFPLQHTEVSANIAGNLSRVEVKQTFTNPYDEPLEAIYKFPLPEDAAVDDMEIRIGDRVIRGLIKEKEKAQEIYQEAKREGKTAGLLEQQRDNIFKQSLANIQPGEQIDVVIRYTNSLQFLGNEYEFVFPMVVAPRYESGTTVSQNRFTWGAPAWASDVGTRSGHDIDVTVDIDAGVALSKVHSPSHPITLQESGASTRVVLADQDVIPNKDLILRYQVMGAETQATVLTQANQQGGHFATYLIPAVEYNAEQIVPKDVVFLIDTSRSQAGAAIEQSRELMRQFISGLHEDDTFNIINFSDSATKLAEKPLANTRENRSKALNYISQLDADGGTELMNG
ncbi:MAG: VIT domain-containing protein, partial [Cyanobacteria bacterium P01_C01_bin.118]